MQDPLSGLELRVAGLFHKAGVPFEPIEHQPVYTYAAAEQVRNEFGLTGTETKSLFLKGKSDGQWAMFVSVEGARLDFKMAKAVLGWKPSTTTAEELTSITGCEPGCAVPLGHPDDVTLLIDTCTYDVERLIFSPGRPQHTVEVEQQQWRSLIESVTNPVIEYGAVSS